MASTSASGSKRKTEYANVFDEIAPAAISSASKPMKRPSYDVFINHRGPDVKSTIATALYCMLTGMALSVFLDAPELEYGDVLPRTIEAAMSSAWLHIAIFSQRYAESPWCLAELAFMLKTGVPIIPIFYYLDPSDVRWVDRGKGMYAQAFKEYERKGRYSLKQLKEWKKALYMVSFYSGQIIATNEDEIRVLKNIANVVLKEINNVPLEVARYPVGLEEIVQDFKSSTFLSAYSNQEVRIVGIWGMGGSGKTTLAKQIYNDMRSSMEGSSFLSDVRDAGTGGLMLQKQKKLLADLGVQGLAFDNVEEGMRILSESLSSLRVLIVCDDVDRVEQLDALLPRIDNLKKGGLIIVTTRDLGVLKSWDIYFIYKMRSLNSLYAKQLFCWHAFLQPYPADGFEESVEKFLKVCDGLPLSLKVYGAQLFGRTNKQYWESLLHKISKTLSYDIKENLKTSYDTLDDEEKEMFLDTACFFIGQKSSLAIEIWDGMGWSGILGLTKLYDKCLVELDNDNLIRMHYHIRDLGREIANQQSCYRLWSLEQIINIQKQKKGKVNIRGINLVPTEIGEWRSSGDEYMANIREEFLLPAPSLVGLKLLVIRGDILNQLVAKVPRKLLWLRWFQIGQRNIPAQLSLKHLRVLELYEDSEGKHHLEELWEEDSDLPLLLRELVISDCPKFRRFPNSIGCLMRLERIIITSGNNLSSLTEEFCRLKSLRHLQLCDCLMLLSLPSKFGDLVNLRYLDLSRCNNLNKLPDSFKYLRLLGYLNLQGCGQLTLRSEDFENITKLEFLNLSGCEQLKELPRHIINQVSLIELYLNRMKMLRELPISIGQLRRLKKMSTGSYLLTSLPDGLGNLSSLTHLSIEDCHNLYRLPDSLGNLSSLTDLSILNCPNLEYCPSSLEKLSSLTNLKIFNCPKLLPDSFEQLTNLEKLNLSGFPQKILPSWIPLRNLRVLELHGANKMEGLWEDEEHAPLQLRELIITGTLSASFRGFPSSISYLKDLKKIALLGDAIKEFGIKGLPEEFFDLQSLEHLELRCCTFLSSLPARFGDLRNLRYLDLCSSKALRMLPVSFKNLKSLKHLDLSGCKRLVLQKDILENIRGLENLCLSGCLALQKIPDHITDQACLRGLQLHHTSLEDLPKNIGQLSKLEVLKIGSPLLKNVPDSLGNLSSLKSLLITDCFALECLPESLGHLVLLEHLCIEATGVSSLPEGFRQLANLRTLKISDCPLKELDFGSGSSFSLVKLREINLSETLVTRISISDECCPRLETLRLSKNDNLEVIETLPATVKNIELSECETLKNIKGTVALPISLNLTVSDCPRLEKASQFRILDSEKPLEAGFVEFSVSEMLV